ncbi:DUF5959 family protein [Streptomyces uncialis]|uniref:DUF5959 family protein n=1 Tax=Streptomyces uncialis TaxID=1048205 RepID=UPI0037FF0B97
MEPTYDGADLVHLADRPGTSGHSVVIRIRDSLSGDGYLECEIAVTAESLNATFRAVVMPEDLEEWESVLETLASRKYAGWLGGGRVPSMRFRPDGHDRMAVTVHDAPSSGVTVTVPLFALPSGWVDAQRALLARARETNPRGTGWTAP